jgi:hypothetical protein
MWSVLSLTLTGLSFCAVTGIWIISDWRWDSHKGIVYSDSKRGHGSKDFEKCCESCSFNHG